MTLMRRIVVLVPGFGKQIEKSLCGLLGKFSSNWMIERALRIGFFVNFRS